MSTFYQRPNKGWRGTAIPFLLNHIQPGEWGYLSRQRADATVQILSAWLRENLFRIRTASYLWRPHWNGVESFPFVSSRVNSFRFKSIRVVSCQVTSFRVESHHSIIAGALVLVGGRTFRLNSSYHWICHTGSLQEEYSLILTRPF